jgi:hypothetical protein
MEAAEDSNLTRFIAGFRRVALLPPQGIPGGDGGCVGNVQPNEVPGRGLEPLLLTEPDPKSGASANFATPATLKIEGNTW